MKHKLLWLILAFATATQALELKPLQPQGEAAHLTAALLDRYHYQPARLDDALSEKIFDHYLKALDGEKLIFLQSDIDRWAEARRQLDDAIANEDLGIPFAIFNLYTQRVTERFTYARSLLKTGGFDFRQDESYQFGRDKAAWPKSDEEVRELWRKRVKNDWLQLKLAGKDDKSIVETLDKRYDNFLKRTARLKSEDAFQIFMNAYTMAIEPHTNYLGPRASENFDISMRLSLVGIGAVLEEKDDYTVIRELVPGGPAALSGKLKVGDRIVGVAQGDKAAPTDVLGWRLDDTVALIRGAADSIVVLDVLPADAGLDGKHKRVSLVRKKISLEEQSAKKKILAVDDGGTPRRIGVISLPGFYQDFEARQKGDPNFKSATRDVARLLAEMKKDKVDGVLIDLRGNGGGSLKEAIELTGLFIDTGPVVQERDARGRIVVDSDTQPGTAWDGPLGVLIDRDSASASEIFAAAIQDYGRGLIIGERSFGKGTVQTMINLDQIAKNDKPLLGDLKLTIAQFFRINGGTTQLRGVTPDIALAPIADDEKFGEASHDNALPWMQIRAASYAPLGEVTPYLPALQARHEARVKKDKDFQDLLDDLADFNRRRKTNLLSLVEAERRKERAALEARLAARGTPSDDGLQPEERKLADELAAEKARKNAKDVFLNEAVNILGDEVALLKSGPRPAGTTTASVERPATPGGLSRDR